MSSPPCPRCWAPAGGTGRLSTTSTCGMLFPLSPLPLESPGATSSLAGTALWLERRGGGCFGRRGLLVCRRGWHLASREEKRPAVFCVSRPPPCWVCCRGRQTKCWTLRIRANPSPLSLSLPSFFLQSLTDSRLDVYVYVCVYVTAYVRMSVLSFFISVLHLGLFFSL